MKGSSLGKKSGPKTSAAAVPYKKKSYHSTVVPIKLASATCVIEVRSPWCSPPTCSMNPLSPRLVSWPRYPR
jgi:hypothetical protein